MLAAGARALAPRARARARASSPARAHLPFASASLAGVAAAPEGGETPTPRPRARVREGDELADVENQLVLEPVVRFDDEDDSHAAARPRVAAASHGQVGLAPDVVHPERDPHPPPDTGSVDLKTYSDEDIATMQVDAPKHAAVVTRSPPGWTMRKRISGARRGTPSRDALSRVRKHGRAAPLLPRRSSRACATSTRRAAGRRTSPSPRTSAARRASAATRTTATCSITSGGLRSERYDPLETVALHDDPNAAIENLVQFGPARLPRRRDAAFANVVLAQGLTDQRQWFSGPSLRRDGKTTRVLEVATERVCHRGTKITPWLPPGAASPRTPPRPLFQLDACQHGTKATQHLPPFSRTRRAARVRRGDQRPHRDARGVDGAWNVFADLDADGEPIHWGDWAITCDDPAFFGKGAPDSGENYGPAPDLDHANPELRFALKRWMAWLRDEIGFGGFRFDFVRGFAPEYVEEYIRSAPARNG